MNRRTVPAAIALGAALCAVPLPPVRSARAQSITNVSVTKNVGNSADDLQAGGDAYQRKTTVAVVSSAATAFTTRFAEIVGADTDTPASRTVTQNSDYTIHFDVTAPGRYTLTVQTLLSGAFTLVDDGNSASADMSAVAGSQTGGTLASGTLNLPDPGSLSGSLGGNVGFNPSATAQITGTSNGSPVTHSLTFTWTASCTSMGLLVIAPGDECAVRLGLPTEYPSDTAGDYPGAGSRDQASDGHFVTVTVTLCGNGVLDPGEQCDDGNTANGDCCSSTCRFESSATVCRPAAGPCDLPESCTGTSAVCPPDFRAPPTQVCRPAVDACDTAETCDGVSVDCPPDTGGRDVNGDGRCDALDRCLATEDPNQPDSDGDGIGDDCDPCTNVLPVFISKPRLNVRGLATPPGNDRLRLSGTLRFPVPLSPAVDPVAKGVRVLLTAASGAIVLDAPIPGGHFQPSTGAGWRFIRASRTWLYRNGGLRAPTVEGIRQVGMRLNINAERALLRVLVVGKAGSYPVAPADLPLTVTLVVDAPVARGGQCGEARFLTSDCAYDARRGRLRCRG